ncbi:hypothetical protein niasHT_012199 [Heterodera trifolii]|uniref:Uncharacterized protein n=1 Tax=Heterodera trifolii TaxID=157864 RepID=A0ABD2KU40_9BILA
MGFVLTVTENNNQNRYYVPVEETDKIWKVRSMAAGMMDTAGENVRLFLNGQPMELLERTDAQYGLHKKSNVTVERLASAGSSASGKPQSPR